MHSAQSHKDSKLFRSLNKVTIADLSLRIFEALPGTLKCANPHAGECTTAMYVIFLQKCYFTHDSVLIYFS